MLRAHAQQLIAELPVVDDVSRRVRDVIARELAHGSPTLESVAGQLHMSRRTLARKLEAEATTFGAILDQLRRELALKYLMGSKLVMADIALLLGFSDGTTFYRSFKRWNGCTPAAYRRQHAQ